MNKIKKIINKIFGIMGYRLIETPEPGLPFVHQVCFGDIVYPFWITDPHTKSWWYKDKQKDTAEMEFLRRTCGNEDMVFDVGAHHGFQSIFIAQLVKSGHVHSFEANPVCALSLDANIGLNRLTNISANLLAIGASTKNIEIHGQSINSDSPDCWEVPMTTLDNYCDEHEIHNVDVLKIDVEGYEGEVLKGAKLLLQKKPHINLELHLDDIADFGWDAKKILNRLPIKDENYEISWIDRNVSWSERNAFSALDLTVQKGVINIFLVNKNRLG